MATIKLTNDALIDNTSLKMGIDTSNVILTRSNTGGGVDWTATQDCWVGFRSNSNNGDYHYIDSSYVGDMVAFVRKGTYVSCGISHYQKASYMRVFGTK